ncbi:MAG: hypothetical protein RIR10_244 [Planctomycetota bacterium]|jgi:hypothetical protein
MPESPKFIERYTCALPEPHCDHCGFALKGLGERGNCPECGTDFDPQTVTVPRRMRRLRVVGYVLLPLAIAVIWFIALVLWLFIEPEWDPQPLLAVALLLPVPLAGAWLGYRATRLTPVVFGRCMPRRRAQSTAAVLASGLCLAIGFFMMFCGVLIAGWLLAVGLLSQSGVDA